MQASIDPSRRQRPRLRVLHLSTDYARQPLYRQLLLSVDSPSIEQRAHVPVRTRAEVGRYGVPEHPRIQVTFSHILRPYHRVFFRSKVRLVESVIRAQGLDLACDLVHAHFLYSDGAVAIRLAERRGIPFVVTVRNTDLHTFMSLRPDLRPIMRRVLRDADRVVVPSPAYAAALPRRLGTGLASVVTEKLVVLPNGVPGHWFETELEAEMSPSGAVRVVFVGDFSRNKNVPSLIDAVARLRESMKARLTLVGGGGDGEADVRRLLEHEERDFVEWLGRVDDPAELASIYRRHDVLVVPSRRETFGLVYIEALSQGLPIVHTRGQGVDGYFEGLGVSKAVDPTQIDSIVGGIRALVGGNRPDPHTCRDAARPFEWAEVGRRYRSLYDDVVAGRRA